jgi:hypothetical protein
MPFLRDIKGFLKEKECYDIHHELQLYSKHIKVSNEASKWNLYRNRLETELCFTIQGPTAV